MLNTDFIRILHVDMATAEHHVEDRPDLLRDYLGGRGCVAECVAASKSIGVGRINAIADTITCLPSCELESLTDEQLLACQDEAALIDAQCD